MTPVQALAAAKKFRLGLINGVLKPMDRWGIETLRYIVQQKMERKNRDPNVDPPNPPPGPLAIRTGGLARTLQERRRLKQQRYRRSPWGRAKERDYWRSAVGKAAQARYYIRGGAATRRKYKRTPRGLRAIAIMRLKQQCPDQWLLGQFQRGML